MEYTINGKTYTQEKLVLGQWAPLVDLLKDKEINDLSPWALVKSLSTDLPRCMALVLVPKGQPVKGRNIDEMEDEFLYGVDMDTAAQIINDFFLCNPPSSLSVKLRDMVRGIASQIALMAPPK